MRKDGIGRLLGRGRAWVGLLGVGLAVEAAAHPGGTPPEQADGGVYCAGCHASTVESDLSGLGEKARSELAEHKHLKAVREGAAVYARLDPAERAKVAALLEAVDHASTVALEAPAEVEAGATFEVRVALTGGAGPRVAVGLVDRPHRLYARALVRRGFGMVGTPRVEGARLYGPGPRAGQGAGGAAPKTPTFFDLDGIASSAQAKRWAKARIVFTLKAPEAPGDYDLYGAYLYGTEKAVKQTTRDDDPRLGVVPLGGATGASGRIRFSAPAKLRVVAPGAGPAVSGGG